MVNQNDILAALQGGADPEAIAQNFADALNAAIAEKAKQEEEAKQAKAAAETHQEKVDYMAEMLAMLNHFIKEFYPDVYDEEIVEKVNAADIVAAFDQAYEQKGDGLLFVVGSLYLVGEIKDYIRRKKYDSI